MLFKVFVDSDVVISSLISSSGAAYLLLNSTDLELFISNLSIKELTIVAERLGIEKKELDDLIKNRFNVVQLKEKPKELKELYGHYTSDPNDCHVVAGAKVAKVEFVISYNIKHFKVDKIKQDFNIILTPPAQLLQYLRSL